MSAAERALSAGDAAACLQLVTPLQGMAGLELRVHELQACAHERCSAERAAAGDHAQALQHYQQFHRHHVDALLLRHGLGDTGTTDALTGLAGRETLRQRLPAMLQLAHANQRGLCLVSMELDPLQPGRIATLPGLADGVLREIGALLRAHSRAKDLPLRYAGETLVLVLSEVELSLARNICERIRRAVQSHDWHPLHPELRVSISMGLTALRSGDDGDALLARAEAGLVSARRDGRNCVRTGVLST